MGVDGIPGTQVFRQRDVRRTAAPTLTQTQSQTIVSPIGSVMAWLKSFTNTPQTLPAGFVECNGQVLSDGDSVYNGQTLPDLNGDNQFLRGNSTSGGTGGAETNNLAHTHDVSGTTNSTGAHAHFIISKEAGTGVGSGAIDIDNAFIGGAPEDDALTNSTGAHTHTFSDTSDSKLSAVQENKPPFYNMVWIMRIK
jgi:hypothetical protein